MGIMAECGPTDSRIRWRFLLSAPGLISIQDLLDVPLKTFSSVDIDLEKSEKTITDQGQFPLKISD